LQTLLTVSYQELSKTNSLWQPSLVMLD
jgi:hypothetical protein